MSWASAGADKAASNEARMVIHTKLRKDIARVSTLSAYSD
jgi:hypothetical protein